MKTDSLKDAVGNSNSNAIATNPGTLGGTTTTTGTTNPSTGATDANFPSCDLSGRYHTVDVGYFGLCQSTVNETLFKVKFSMTTSVRNCLIPTYKGSDGSSTYIGQPQCTLVNQADEVIQGSLYKNRQGWENTTLNGVIVLKEPLLPEYFNCMNAYSNWRPQTSCPSGPNASPKCYNLYYYCPQGVPQGTYSYGPVQDCKTEASNYMSYLCNSFKSKYSSSYLDIRTK